MQKMLTIEIPAEEAEKAETEIEQLLGEMRAITGRLKQNSAEIRRIQAHTRSILDELDNFRLRPTV